MESLDSSECGRTKDSEMDLLLVKGAIGIRSSSYKEGGHDFHGSNPPTSQLQRFCCSAIVFAVQNPDPLYPTQSLLRLPLVFETHRLKINKLMEIAKINISLGHFIITVFRLLMEGLLRFGCAERRCRFPHARECDTLVLPLDYTILCAGYFKYIKNSR